MGRGGEGGRGGARTEELAVAASPGDGGPGQPLKLRAHNS